MNNEELAGRALQYVESLLPDNADGHDVGHALRVYHNAMQIAAEEPGCDRAVISLAAILHDVDDHKLFQTDNQANARKFLDEAGIPADTVDQICHVISGVSFSQNRGKKPDTLEGQIVQDADRLDAIGAIGIARVFSYGGAHGRSLEQSIHHFYDKLFLLKDEMNTRTARKIAEERHQFMEAYIEQLKNETGVSV